jgi:hypothetical protein
MRLTPDTHFQYTDAAPAVHVTLLGGRRMPSLLPVVRTTADPRPIRPYALARRPMR